MSFVRYFFLFIPPFLHNRQTPERVTCIYFHGVKGTGMKINFSIVFPLFLLSITKRYAYVCERVGTSLKHNIIRYLYYFVYYAHTPPIDLLKTNSGQDIIQTFKLK